MRGARIFMNKKRILIIADSNLSNSGVPMVFMSIVRALKSDYIFDVIIFNEDDMFYKNEFLSYGGKIYVFNRKIPDGKFAKVFWLLFKLKKDVDKFCGEKISLKDYFAIHSFDEMFSSRFLKIGKDCGIKYRVVHVCAAFRAYKTKKSLKRYLFEIDRRKTLKLCTSIACSSDSTLKLNNYKNKGLTLYRTYNQSQFPGVIKCVHDNLVLTQIATFSERKNQLFALEVVSILKNTYPNVVLNLVGKEKEDGYEDKMNNYIRNHSLENNVKFLGTSPNRYELSKMTSYILHPATMEGSGNVLVESQICGIHCFASASLPEGYDLGNVQFLELNASTWSDSIIKYFKDHKNNRKPPINKERFSLNNFKTIVLRTMSDNL